MKVVPRENKARAKEKTGAHGREGEDPKKGPEREQGGGGFGYSRFTESEGLVP